MQKLILGILLMGSSLTPAIAQNLELYWMPGLTLGYASFSQTGEPLQAKPLWAVWFQYGHWGARFYPTKKEDHSVELDAIWFHTNPYGMDVRFEPDPVNFGGGYVGVKSYADFSGFGVGYNYNLYLPKAIQFTPGIKFNFFFRGVTSPSGVGGAYTHYNPSNGTYEQRSFTLLGGIVAPWSASVSFPVRFTWYSKKNVFLRWGVQYYLGFRKASYEQFTNYDAYGNIISQATAYNRNRSLSVELGLGYKFDWERLKRR